MTDAETPDMTMPDAAASRGWVPPVLPWPALHSQPTCTLSAAVPANVLVATLGEELRRRRLRVRAAPDGLSLRAKPYWPIVATVIGIAVGEVDSWMPKLDISVAAQTPTGTTVTVLVRADGFTGMKERVTQALNATAWRLAHQGVTLTATPWERYSRFRKA